MKKALNFDLDTKKYEKITGKNSSGAYNKIKRYLKNNDFEHRQGSGYISKESLTDIKVLTVVRNMSIELIWLRECVRQIDVTNIGRQYSLIKAVVEAPKGYNKNNIEI